jgi:ABC-type glutathione transport system ATPase component
VLADEPMTARDVVVQRGVVQLLDEIRQRLGGPLVLVAHDRGVRANFADCAAVLSAGR